MQVTEDFKTRFDISRLIM